MSNFQPLVVVGHGSGTQLQVGGYFNCAECVHHHSFVQSYIFSNCISLIKLSMLSANHVYNSCNNTLLIRA